MLGFRPIQLPVRALVVAAALVQAGCGDANFARFGNSENDGQVDRKATGSFVQEEDRESSEILTTLLMRQGVVPPNTALGQVGNIALASSTGTSQSELRAARLRAEAESKNWLPTIGPTISLSSLADVLAGIVVEQVLFDYGRKKGERDFAAADVEVAAVSLSQDMNGRIYTAQSLYVEAVRGDEKARLGDLALSRLEGFRRIVAGRVSGGVANKGDLRMLDEKIRTMRSMRDTSAEDGASALAELTAMTGARPSLQPTESLPFSNYDSVEALSVLKASAEANRSIARATVERADQLPGIGATGNIANVGTSGRIELSGETGLGLGTGARLKAIESTRETAWRQVDDASEESARSRTRLEKEILSQNRQQREALQQARDGRETFNLFEAQFKAGQRSVLEVVDVYEQSVRREVAAVDAGYDMLLAQLELARDLGLLVDGDAI